MKRDKDKEMKELAEAIVPQLIESAFVNGDITAEDFFNKDNLLKKLKRSLPKDDKDLFFTIIHYPGLLDRAKKAVDKEDWEYVYVFYATYFEHFINEIMHIWGIKHKKSPKVIKELVRRVSIEDKYTWLLEILGLPKFNDKHVKTIKQLSEKRNAFIHYKYEPLSAEEPIEKQQNEWRKVQSSVTAAIAYSKRYRSKIVWDGKKHKI